MELTAHSGARPSHAEWQGQIVSLSGQDGYLSLDSIGYGTVTGFKGINCRHDWRPYYPGSPRTYTDEELEALKNETVMYNGEEISKYEATQIQRQLERQIRNSKKEINGLQGLLTSNNELLVENSKIQLLNAQSKLINNTTILNNFLKQTGLKLDSNRLYVGTASTVLNNTSNDDIIITRIKQISGRKNTKVELSYNIPEDIENYLFDYNHINTERNHNVNKEEAISYIKNSKMKMTVWQGRYEKYYSDDGVTFIDTKNKIIRSSFKEEEFDEKTKQYMEVINYGK